MQATKFSVKLLAAVLAALLCAAPAFGAETEIAAEPVWAKRFGAGYGSAPTPALVDGDYLYIFSGRRLALVNRLTGEAEKTTPADTELFAGYALNPPVKGGGMIFVPLCRDLPKNGVVAAFDAETLELLWSIDAGGQCASPITYSDGKIFFGTWIAEGKSGLYYGYSADKNGCERLWSIEHAGGFYRAGALCENGRLYFGSDDCGGGATLYCTDAETGQVLSRTDNIEGDIRCDIVRCGDSLIFATKAGYLYKLGGGGLSRAELGAACASTPAADGGLAYAGTADKCVSVVDLSSMTLVRKITAPAYPNGGIFIRGGFIYATCNSKPGGVYCCPTDGSSLKLLYAPAEEAMQDYGISPVAFGGGMLYYKNDSGYVFGLELAAKVKITAGSDETVWLVRPEENTVQKIPIKKGENNLEIRGEGRAFLWREFLKPLTEVICL